MKFLISGGTGFIGQYLVAHWVKQGHEVSILTRSKKKNRNNNTSKIAYYNWNEKDTWYPLLPNINVIVNLAGAPIFQRWTATNKKNILESRIHPTRHLINGLKSTKASPQLFINASAIGYYGNPNQVRTEEHGPGTDFLSTVCQAWETEALSTGPLSIRTCLLRIGIVLGENGGVLARLNPIFKMYLGGHFGNGTIPYSWIHITDIAHIIDFLVKHKTISGPINATSPGHVNMKEFCAILGKTLNRPSYMHLPEWCLKLGLGEMSSIMLSSPTVYPKKLLDAGYTFKFKTIDKAFKALFP